MKFTLLKEPNLEFANGNTALCPKDGLRRFTPYDMGLVRPQSVKLGIIGRSDSVDPILEWIEKGRHFIDAKKSKQLKLFPSFMGFQSQNGFCSTIEFDDSYIRKIKNTEFDDVYNAESENAIIEKAVELYLADIKFLAKNKDPDVILIVIPETFVQRLNPKTNDSQESDEDSVEEVQDEEEEDADDGESLEFNFRRMLKAAAMKHHIPIQIVRDRIVKPSGEMQDEASIAWNFYTALYYKASGTPWALAKTSSSIVCYAGISFYKSRDRSTTQTSIAQIFNELGKGVILRGEDPVKVSKQDPIPHLSDEQAFRLLDRGLAEYKEAIDIFPQRLVVHKTSNFTDGEKAGFIAAAKKNNISALDLITIHQRTQFRLFRDGRYPPLRGSLFSYDDRNHLLYTRGSVPYFETYPGQYIPHPLQIRFFSNDESPETICNEILGLTKMNWNNTQFDRRFPITIECARKVGDILKYLPLGEQEIELRYSFYM